LGDRKSSLLDDLKALASAAPREAGSEGEFAMIDKLKGRMGEEASSRIEGFVGHVSPEVIVGVHASLLLLAGLLGLAQPALATAICALVTASLVAEGIGHVSAIRWLVRKSPSYNLVISRTVEEAVGTVVFVASLDSRRWRVPVRGRFIKRPLKSVLAAALVVTTILALRTFAEPWGKPTVGLYVGSLGVLALTMAIGVVAHRRDYVGSGDSSDLAIMLDLIRRFDAKPLESLESWFLFAGCSRAHQDGMHAFLDRRGEHMAKPTLVIGLEETLRAPLSATISEGSLWAQHHRSTGPALIERLRWAGVDVLMLDRPGSTNARAAMVRGYRALTICGGDGTPNPVQLDSAVDVAERVARWFGQDLVRSVSNRLPNDDSPG
jgi:uncharacterized membrane protein HdeD (DUF308 family)